MSIHALRCRAPAQPEQSLLAAIRNARAAIGADIGAVGWFRDAPALLSACLRSGVQCDKLRAGIPAAARSIRAAEHDRSFSTKIRLLIELDSLYYWLFYASPTTLPDPTEYFTTLVLAFSGDARQNSLQRLLSARCIETTQLFAREKHDLARLHPSGMAGDDETMKCGDPMCPSALLAAWRDSIRDFPCHVYAYAVPNASALREISRHAPIVELGAGTGYWASLLHRVHVEIVAFDRDPPSSQRHNEYHGRCSTFSTVRRGDSSALQDHAGAALLLCYPPPDSSMALDALNAYPGDTVLYVGEWDGDTATAAFQSRLQSAFLLLRRVPLPNWPNTCYDLTVWRRREKPASSAEKNHRCTTCGELFSNVRRCRLTCAVQFCSSLCQTAGIAVHAQQLLHRHLNIAASLLEFDNPLHFRLMGSPTPAAGITITKKRKR